VRETLRLLRTPAFYRVWALLASYGEIVLLTWIFYLLKTGGLFGLW
jgi:hypothetical protein